MTMKREKPKGALQVCSVSFYSDTIESEHLPPAYCKGRNLRDEKIKQMMVDSLSKSETDGDIFADVRRIYGLREPTVESSFCFVKYGSQISEDFGETP